MTQSRSVRRIRNQNGSDTGGLCLCVDECIKLFPSHLDLQEEDDQR